MKIETYTVKCDEFKTFTMPCWFCNQSVMPGSFDFDTPQCPSALCQKSDVTYVFSQVVKNNSEDTDYKTLIKVFFKVILSDQVYFVTYYPFDQNMSVEKIISFRASFLPDPAVSTRYMLDHVLQIPCNSTFLTPYNAQDKLPTLITFS